MDKNLLLKTFFPEEEVEIPGKGTVRVRSISRAELHSWNKPGKDADAGELERRTVQAGLIDPKLTYDEVCTWFENASAGEIQPVVKAIMRLSGLSEGANKSV